MWPFRIIRLKGQSMEPDLADGDFVVTSRLFWRLKPGDNIVFSHECYPIMVKRVVEVASNGEVWVRGNHPASIQSSQIGWIKPQQIRAKVIFAVRHDH